METNNFEMMPVNKMREIAYDYANNEELERELILTLSNVLMDAGITPAYKGFNYIIDSVRILYRKGYRHLLVTKDIYQPISELYDTNPQLIEHCIRTAIKRGFTKTTDEECIKHLYAGGTECPTNYTFLVSLSRFVYKRING